MKEIFREDYELAAFVCRVRCENESVKVLITQCIAPRVYVLRVVDRVSVIVKEKTPVQATSTKLQVAP
jgi:hypothetical protein